MVNWRLVLQGYYEEPHTSDDYANMDATISYKPETSWNYEVGAHLNLFEGRLHADLSAFYMQVHNQQLSVMAGTYGYGRMMVNAGKSYSCGCGGGYGNYVMISHAEGKMTVYGHLTSLTVSTGQTVSRGQVIGYVGSTGNSTGPHLHYECRLNGVRYNPMSEY